MEKPWFPPWLWLVAGAFYLLWEDISLYVFKQKLQTATMHTRLLQWDQVIRWSNCLGHNRSDASLVICSNARR